MNSIYEDISITFYISKTTPSCTDNKSSNVACLYLREQLIWKFTVLTDFIYSLQRKGLDYIIPHFQSLDLSTTTKYSECRVNAQKRESKTLVEPRRCRGRFSSMLIVTDHWDSFASVSLFGLCNNFVKTPTERCYYFSQFQMLQSLVLLLMFACLFLKTTSNIILSNWNSSSVTYEMAS